MSVISLIVTFDQRSQKKLNLNIVSFIFEAGISFKILKKDSSKSSSIR